MEVKKKKGSKNEKKSCSLFGFFNMGKNYF